MDHETRADNSIDGGTRGDFDSTIRTRRTVRLFDSSRAVPDELLKRLLELSSLAPSPSNLQPWRFLVVREPANRERLRRCAGHQPCITQAPAVVVVLGYEQPCRTHLEPIVKTAIQVGAVTAAQAAEWRGRALADDARRQDRGTWAIGQAMLAAATLMLAAEAYCLGSALLEVPDPDLLKDGFGIPNDHHVACLVALGYPTEVAPFPGRLNSEDLCHGEHFGAPFSPE